MPYLLFTQLYSFLIYVLQYRYIDGGRFPKFATPTSNLLSRLLSRSTPQHGFIAFRITAIRKHEVGSGTALPITNFQKLVFTSSSERGAIVVNTISLLRGILIDHVVGCGSRRCPGWLLCRVMGYRWFWCFTPAAGTPGCSIAYDALSVRLMIKVTFHLVWVKELVQMCTCRNNLTPNGSLPGMSSGTSSFKLRVNNQIMEQTYILVRWRSKRWKDCKCTVLRCLSLTSFRSSCEPLRQQD